MRKTCPKSEYLLINDEIKSLAERLLSNEEIQEADHIALDLTKKSTKRLAIRKLQKMVGFWPKRPLYYVNFELNSLPHWTRDSVRYIGDFIDVLVKYLAAEKLQNPKCMERSLGINLRNLKNKIPESLYFELERYDELIYKPAKHDFSVENRKHLFTSKEVVLIVYISFKIKDKIIEISEEARKFCEIKNYEGFKDSE